MKKRLLAFLLAVSIAVSMLVMPASAAGNNTAVQFAITLGAMDSEQSGALNAAVTRGAFARMLTSYSTYRESVSSQGAVGTLYTDLPGSSAWAPWESGYPGLWVGSPLPSFPSTSTARAIGAARPPCSKWSALKAMDPSPSNSRRTGRTDSA